MIALKLYLVFDRSGKFLFHVPAADVHEALRDGQAREVDGAKIEKEVRAELAAKARQQEPDPRLAQPEEESRAETPSAKLKKKTTKATKSTKPAKRVKKGKK